MRQGHGGKQQLTLSSPMRVERQRSQHAVKRRLACQVVWES